MSSPTQCRLCISNLVLLTFLALRNTPLAFLTAYSYERLNSLHQIAGYTTILCAVLHGSLQSVTFVQAGESFVLLETGQIVGIIAVLSFIITGLVATILRPVQYETFYVIHVTMFMLILITIGMHRPQLSQQVLYWIIIAGALWFTDRLIRGSRILWNMRHNTVSLTPLPGRGIRLSLSRPLYRATPGSHVFLWVPSIRAFETHPFTIASVDPLELVIKAHDGFTGELLAQAEKNPSQSLIASVDGPYGTLPDFTAFDHVVLVAGGSGASFTFGVAINLLRQRGDNTTMGIPTIEFLWTVRHSRRFYLTTSNVIITDLI
jgi:predicted ferric reductase